MNATKVRLPGRFFRPFSELEDGQSLACYYTRICRKTQKSEKKQRSDYPLSVVIGTQHFSIYWHGHSLESGREWNFDTLEEKGNWEDYGLHRILSFDFSQLHRDVFENWLKIGKLLPKDIILEGINKEKNAIYKRLQEVHNTNESAMLSHSFSNTFFQNPSAHELVSSINKLKITTPDPFQAFFLDLLFDLYHSDLFRGHPAYSSLLGFLETIPIVKAIRLKAEHRYALFQLNKAYSIASKIVIEENEDQNQKKGTTKAELLKSFIQKPFKGANPANSTKTDRESHWESEDEKAASHWLEFLRSSEVDIVIQEDKDKCWFADVELEHERIYRASNASHLKSQAEKSVQWLIGRYAFGKAYLLQFFRVFSGYSRIVLLGASIVFITMYYRGHQWFNFLPRITDFADCHWLFSGMTAISAFGMAALAALLFERVVYFLISFFNWLPEKWKNEWRWKKPSRTPGEVLLSFPKIIATLKPKILLASSAAWVFILSTDFPWNLDFIMSAIKWKIIALVAIVTFLFMAAHFTTLVGQRNKLLNVFRRGFFVFLLASIYSFTIGFIGMASVAENHFTKEERLSTYLKGFSTLVAEIPQNPKSPFFKIGRDQWLYNFAIQDLYHYYDSKSNNRVFFVHKMNLESNDQDKAFDLSVRYAIVIEPLLFFTFIAVAVGILLEMGLQLQKPNLGFE